MNLKSRLQAQTQKQNVKWEIIEQDYILSWVLEGISRVPELKNNLVFKGGTALKKVYFGDYRFSQDLDFSGRNNLKIFTGLDGLIQSACTQASETIRYSGENVELKSEPYLEKRPHPEGQKAYVIQARLPWHRDFHTKIYVEISFEEIILMQPEERQIIYPYDELDQGSIYVYPLEEIVAEKIRALLQFAKKLHERSWGRSRVRDYYDIWRILKSYSDKLHLNILPDLVQKKCAHKAVSFEKIEDVFQEKLLLNLEQEWQPWLADIVKNLPNKGIVLSDLREILIPIFNSQQK